MSKEEFNLKYEALKIYCKQDTWAMVDILNNLVQFILRNLPLLLQAAIKIVGELAIGIGKAAPDLIPAIVDCILTIVDTLLEPENIKLIIYAAFELIKGIIKGILLAIPKIVEKVPDIVINIAKEIKNNVDKIVDAGKELIKGLTENENNTNIWKSEIFGRSLDVIVQEGIQAKLSLMPENTRYKLSNTVTKLVNKGSNNLIAIVL